MKNILIDTITGSTEPVSIDDLAHLCAVEPQWIVRVVEVGIVHPDTGGTEPGSWRFSSLSISRAIEARKLEHLLETNLDAVAMLMDLSHEVRHLKTLLRIHGIKDDVTDLI